MCLCRYCARRHGKPQPENGKTRKWGSNSGPKTGATSRPQNGCHVTKNKQTGVHLAAPTIDQFSSTQPVAVWQWCRFWHRQVPEAVSPLLLNLDETCIRFFYTPRVGMRLRGRRRGPKGTSHVRHSTRAQLRKALTHVAVICDDPALQPTIPQILLLSKKATTLKQLQGWQPLRGCNVEVWRCDSAWVNKPVFARIIARLGEWHRRCAPHKQLILMMDAHSVHCSETVIAAARKEGIWVCIIPASTTSLLQPLDTDVFARFKMFLRAKLHQMMLTDGNKDMDVKQLLLALQESMKGVMQRHEWAPVFLKNGFGSKMQVRNSLLQALGWTAQPQIEEGLPSHSQFMHCFPSGRPIPYRDLLTPLVPRSQRPPAPPEAPSADILAPSEALPWSERLRPRLKRPAAAPVQDITDPTMDCSPEALPHLGPLPTPAVFDVTTGQRLHSVLPSPPRKGRPAAGSSTDPVDAARSSLT